METKNGPFRKKISTIRLRTKRVIVGKRHVNKGLCHDLYLTQHDGKGFNGLEGARPLTDKPMSDQRTNEEPQSPTALK